MRRILLLGLLLIVTARPVAGQRWIYDSSRDAKAQAAAAAAKDAGSTALLDSELKNLDLLAKEQVELIERWQLIQVRSQINAFQSWSQLRQFLADTRQSLKTAVDLDSEKGLIDQRVAEVKDLGESIQHEIEETAKHAGEKQEMVKETLSSAAGAKPTEEFAKSIAGSQNPATLQALNEVVSALEQVAKLYAAMANIAQTEQAVNVPISALRPDPLKTRLKLCKAEADHWTNLGVIAARERLEVGEAVTTLDFAESYLSKAVTPQTPDDIETSLSGMAGFRDQNHLEFALYTLHYAASVAARQKNASDIAGLRNTLEERRYNLERRAIIAGDSEQMVQAASARLAAYWKSGLKPKDVADLLFDLAGAVSLPVIAAK